MNHDIIRSIAWGTIFAGLCALTGAAVAQTPEQTEKIKAAAPDKAYAKPTKPRKLLVFSATRGYRHGSIPVGVEAMKILGRKTGAFDVVDSEDIAVFEPDSLKRFDAVCMLSTTGELFTPPNLAKMPENQRNEAMAREKRLKKSLLNFVDAGGGLVGIHAATDCFYKWPEYGRMIGGYFDGHPWHEKVGIKVERPDHPLCRMFNGDRFEIVDEIYQFRDPYSRTRQNVLLSIDTERTDMSKKNIKRRDGDFAVSWARRQGEGRVFYCSLGHRDEIYWNPSVLRHYLAGIQFALGDLNIPASKRNISTQQPTAPPGFTALFNGKDLTGWKGLVGNPESRGKLSTADLAAEQARADQVMRQHWSVDNGVLVYDGDKSGSHLCTAKDYKDFELLIDWRITPGGDSGIYLRGSPQVQIWDPARWPEGSGGLYNNRFNPSKPRVRADNRVGEWNRFRIKMIGKRVTVWLNSALVVDDVVLENYWQRGKAIYPAGQIELQKHDGELRFRNIFIRAIGDDEAAAALKKPTWQMLFNDRNLARWKCKPGSWVVRDGVLTRGKGGGYIWTEDEFGDFSLELEFKLDKGTNSGIFFRTADVNDPVQTGIEFQVYDTHDQKEPVKNSCGAIYDCVAPAINAVRKAGEWNHVVITCRGPLITASMNGAAIIDMNLDEWTEPHMNPDGSKNKFRTAYKDMPRVGHIGFQDHGNPIWYRNIRIKRLGD